MSETLQLEILTPERQAFSESVESVYLQGSEGRLGILPMHTTLIAKLDFGELAYQQGGREERVLCGNGLVEVANDHVTVLVHSAERRQEIDVERAQFALDRSRARRDSKAEDVDLAQAEAARKRALERLRFAAGK
jgi:F-type H+-transporting ATPase subunit epsilon